MFTDFQIWIVRNAYISVRGDVSTMAGVVGVSHPPARLHRAAQASFPISAISNFNPAKFHRGLDSFSSNNQANDVVYGRTTSSRLSPASWVLILLPRLSS